MTVEWARTGTVAAPDAGRVEIKVDGQSVAFVLALSMLAQAVAAGIFYYRRRE